MKISYTFIKKLFLTVLSITTLIQSTQAKSQNCYVLALEGGGDKGAYQSGAFKGLVNKLPEDKRSYDVITGISVGSMNAGVILTFEKGQEVQAADFLIDSWKNLKGSSEIYINWNLGLLNGLLFKNSLYDSTPLKTFLTNTVKGRSIQRKFVVGATSSKTGKYRTWDEKDITTLEDLVTIVRASSAVPVIFIPIEIDGEYFVDGGTTNSIDIYSGINKCIEMGYKQEEIFVDMIRCKPNSDLDDVDVSKYNSLQMLFRFIQLESNNFFTQNVERVYNSFPNVNFRYMVAPEEKLPSSLFPLSFSKEQIEEMIDIGIKDAERIVEAYGERGNAGNRNHSNRKNFEFLE